MQRWLDYIQAPDKSKAVEPGPVDNNAIARHLIEMQSANEQVNKNFQYYSVSKHLFYFFQSIYGGGPILVQSAHWHQYEGRFRPIRDAN